uniref:Uncharacterized protein n=1 Tax=Eutreptiella gymnastica TaxID=73025 RepID=A0A7S4CU15_9EUGL
MSLKPHPWIPPPLLLVKAAPVSEQQGVVFPRLFGTIKVGGSFFWWSMEVTFFGVWCFFGDLVFWDVFFFGMLLSAPLLVAPPYMCHALFCTVLHFWRMFHDQYWWYGIL